MKWEERRNVGGKNTRKRKMGDMDRVQSWTLLFFPFWKSTQKKITKIAIIYKFKTQELVTNQYKL